MINRYQIVIGNSIIWAAVIFATALVLQGTGHFGELIPILMGGAGGSLVILSRAMRPAKNC